MPQTADLRVIVALSFSLVRTPHAVFLRIAPTSRDVNTFPHCGQPMRACSNDADPSNGIAEGREARCGHG